MTDPKIDISSFELDELREVVNIGASHASDVLSKLVNSRVLLTVPEAKIIPSIDLAGIIAGQDENITTVSVGISGDAFGAMLFVFPENSGHDIARLIYQNKQDKSADSLENTGVEISRRDLSALREAGNILAGAYLTALAKFLKVRMLHSVSRVHRDKAEDVVRNLTGQSAQDEVSLVFKVVLGIGGTKAQTRMFILADSSFSRQLLELARKAF